MDFLIFSDSHGHGERMTAALRRQVRCPDAVIFLGDGLRDTGAIDTGNVTLFAVRGNCDLFCSDPSITADLTLSFEGHRLFCTHGHLYGVKGGVGALLSHAAKQGADIVLFGHTHTPICEVIPEGSEVGGTVLPRPMYLFNPGSVGAGSFGTLMLTEKAVLFSHGKV